MTRVATHGCLALLVAVDAPFHLQWLLKTYDLLRRDIAVTLHTLDLRCGVRPVTEKDKARQLVDQLQWDLPFSKILVTTLALCQSRKARPIRALGILVAECTLLLQRRVLLVIERPVLAPQTQGKE
jgi:hypothetical protein